MYLLLTKAEVVSHQQKLDLSMTPIAKMSTHVLSSLYMCEKSKMESLQAYKQSSNLLGILQGTMEGFLVAPTTNCESHSI